MLNIILNFLWYIDIFCGGYLDGSIKIFDARVSHTNDNVNCDYNIPKAHGKYK